MPVQWGEVTHVTANHKHIWQKKKKEQFTNSGSLASTINIMLSEIIDAFGTQWGILRIHVNMNFVHSKFMFGEDTPPLHLHIYSITCMNFPSGHFHCLMLSGAPEANMYSSGWMARARTLFLWCVRVQVLLPAPRSHRRIVKSCEPVMTCEMEDK